LFYASFQVTEATPIHGYELLRLLGPVFFLLGKLQRCWHHGSLYGEPPEPSLSDTQIQTRRRRIDLPLGIQLDLVIAPTVQVIANEFLTPRVIEVST